VTSDDARDSAMRHHCGQPTLLQRCAAFCGVQTLLRLHLSACVASSLQHVLQPHASFIFTCRRAVAADRLGGLCCLRCLAACAGSGWCCGALQTDPGAEAGDRVSTQHAAHADNLHCFGLSLHEASIFSRAAQTSGSRKERTRVPQLHVPAELLAALEHCIRR